MFRQLLEQLIGKTVVEVSFTDADEVLRGHPLNLYLFFEDGSVLETGRDLYRIHAPGQYQGR